MANPNQRAFVERLLAEAFYPTSAAHARELLAYLDRQGTQCVARGLEWRRTAELLGIHTERDANAYDEAVEEERALLDRINEAMAHLRGVLPALERREANARALREQLVQQLRFSPRLRYPRLGEVS